MKLFKKLIAIAVSATMLMSLASCDQLSDLGKNSKKNKKTSDDEDEVIELVDNYSKALISSNGKKILKYSDSDFSEDHEDLADELDFVSSYDSDICDILIAISDTMEYTYQEDSLKIKKNEAEADVLITFADYKNFLEDDEASRDTNSFIDAVSTADVKHRDSLMITIEMNRIDDEWVVVNSEDIIEDVFLFTEIDYTFLTLDPETKANLSVVSSSFFNNLTNAEEIVVELAFTEDSDENHDVYYNVLFNGEEVYNSDLVDGDKALVYGKKQNAELTNEGYLIPGDYEFIISNSDNIEIYSTYTLVETEEAPAPTTADPATPTTPTTDKNEIISSNKGQLDIVANGFSENSEVYAAPVDYAKSFSKDFNIGDMYVGNLYMPIYIVLDGDNSAIIIDTVTFMDNLYIFAENNFDALLTNSFGVSIEEYAELTGVSIEEAREVLMDAMFSGMDSSREESGDLKIEIIGVTYEIDGDNIILTNKVGGKVTTAQYNGDSIILNAEELDAVEDLDDTNITFEKIS